MTGMREQLTAEFIALQEALAGRYSLEHELGRGGMGIVYLAHEVALDRPVALKLLPPELAAQPALRERFLREARTAAGLSHPNIVPIYAVDEIAGYVFFAMAFVDGETLGQRVRSRGPLSSSDAARLLREVAWALAYAHVHGIVHRDIKPDNVLVEKGSGRALVADFGIAHVRDAPGMTGVGEVLGTAEFMSPEQASGEPVDARSDIYSLGVVGFYALSAELPFQAETVSGLLAQHITQPAPLVNTVAPEVPRKLVQVIDRCLAKEPERRFANGEELAKAFGRSLEERRELPVPLRVFIKQSRKSMRIVGPIALVLFLLGGRLTLAVIEGDLLLLGGALGAMTLGFTMVPFGLMAYTARRLLKSGYGLDDAIAAAEADLQRRREELAFEFGSKTSRSERIAKRITLTALAVVAVGAGGLALGIGGAGFLVGIAASTALLSGLFAARERERRRDVEGERRLKTWKSRRGGWLFKLAAVGLKPASPSGATFRRTELAIGLAADRLFEELPKAVRRNLKELPDVMRRLEGDAQKIRARIEELNGLLGAIGGAQVSSKVMAAASSKGDRTLADKSEELAKKLAGARDLAQRRLADTVTALETVRLDLLRMQAGTGTAQSITTDLASARELSDDIERLLEGQMEVEAALQGDSLARLTAR